MPEESFEQHHARSLETYHAEKNSWARKEADYIKQIAERDVRIEQLEKTAKYRTITLDTVVREPLISTKQDNTVRFVNAGYVTIAGYIEAEVVGKPITEFIRGLEFLTQFYEHPELIAAESHESLREVPVILSTKDKKDLRMLANIGFSPSETPGYHGVTIICQPQVDKRWYGVFTRLFTGPWLSRWYIIKAKDYADNGVLALPDSPLPSRDVCPADRFLQEATREVRKQANRGVAIKFDDVISCNDKVYELLVSVAKVSEVPFTCFVGEDSAILAGLQQAKFPDKHLKIVKRKKEKKNNH